MDSNSRIGRLQNLDHDLPTLEKTPTLPQKIWNVAKGVFATLFCLVLYTINPLYFIASIGYGMSFPESVKETSKRIHLIMTSFPVRCSLAIAFALLVTPAPIVHFYASIFAGTQVGIWIHEEVKRRMPPSTDNQGAAHAV